MAITFETNELGLTGSGITIYDNHPIYESRLKLTYVEALQVRDELNRRYPPGIQQIALMLEKLGALWVTVLSNEGKPAKRCVFNYGLSVVYVDSGRHTPPPPRCRSKSASGICGAMAQKPKL